MLIIALFIFLRVPSFFEGFWYPDEGFYAAQAEAILRGKELYIGAWDHKPPMMVWIYTFAGIFGWDWGYVFVKLMNISAGVFSVLVFERLMRRVGIKVKLKNFILIIFAIVLGTPLLEGNLANSEVFYIPATLSILYLSLYGQRPYLVGMLLSYAFLIKPQAFIESIAVITLVGIFDFWKKRTKFDFKYYFKVFLVYILIIGVYFAYLLLRGTFDDFIDATLLTNFRYVELEEDANYWNLVKIVGSALIFYYALIKLHQNQISRKVFVIFLTLVVDITLVTLSGRPYMHYLIQLLPISLLSLVIYLQSKPTSKFHLAELILGFLVLITFLFSKGFNFPVIERERFDGHIRYYSDFPQYLILGKRDGHSWFWKEHNFFKPRKELIEHFKENYQGVDYYYYGDDPWIFTQLDGNFKNKYLVWYHLVYSDAKMQEAVKLRDESLVLIVDEESDQTLIKFFETADNFTFSEKVHNYSIYINNEKG